MPSEQVNEATRKEWRELGFFYDCDATMKSWRIVGTPVGLRKFARLVREYASNPKNESPSEHEHFGPYQYLEIGTWHHPEITDHWIAGPLKTLSALASLVEKTTERLKAGERASLRQDFAPASPYDLIVEVREETFDPAKADAECW